MQADIQTFDIAGVSASRIFKAISLIVIAALGAGIGFLASRMAIADAVAQPPVALYVGNVHVGFPEGEMAARQAREEWIGSDMVHVLRTLGQPTQIYWLRDTGGEMLIYSRPFHEHLVFEVVPTQATHVVPAR